MQHKKNYHIHYCQYHWPKNSLECISMLAYSCEQPLFDIYNVLHMSVRHGSLHFHLKCPLVLFCGCYPLCIVYVFSTFEILFLLKSPFYILSPVFAIFTFVWVSVLTILHSILEATSGKFKLLKPLNIKSVDRIEIYLLNSIRRRHVCS